LALDDRHNEAGAYKEATVYKHDLTHWLRFQLQGKEIRRSAHTSSKAAAQLFLVQLLDKHGRLDRGARPRCTYKEVPERFTHDYLPMLKTRSQRRDRTSFRQSDIVFGNLFLDEIGRSRLARLARLRHPMD
jgi:hypothetical protein